MKKSILWMGFLLMYLNQVEATNFYVRSSGLDSNDGLSFAKAFKTIQSATNRVKSGDSVFVFDGNYKGFDHFYKGSGTAGNEIVYMAMGNQVVVNQSCGRGFDGINIEGANYIQLIGFKVTRIFDLSGSGEDGIRVVLADHITVKHCEVDSCYRGIFIGYSDHFLAENNICKNSYGEHGIYVSNNSDHVVIRYNQCFGNFRAAGIQLNPDLSSGAPGISKDVWIHHNICYNNRIGLNLQGIYDSYVYNNLIYNNGMGGGGNGITLFHGDAATGCNNVKVYHNTVVVPATSQWAILAIESDSLFVYNNILLSLSPKGCLDIETSCSNYFSDYNLLNDRMTTNQGSSYINFKEWQNFGHDLNSTLISDNHSVFENLVNLNFHLKPGSSAINNGTSAVMNLVTNDLDLIQRPQGTGFDIGCYEMKETVRNTNISNQIKPVWLNHQLNFPALQDHQEVILFDLYGKTIGRGRTFDKHSLVNGIILYSIFDKKTGRYLGSGSIFN